MPVAAVAIAAMEDVGQSPCEVGAAFAATVVHPSTSVTNGLLETCLRRTVKVTGRINVVLEAIGKDTASDAPEKTVVTVGPAVSPLLQVEIVGTNVPTTVVAQEV